MRNKYIFLILIFLFLGQTSAQKIIGVSPADVYFRDVLRGGYSERYVSITLNSDEKVKMEVEPWGDIANWLNFSESEYSVSTKNPWRLLISLSPPNDIPNGNYTGFVRISSSALDQDGKEGHAVGTVLAVVDLAIHVEIIDKEKVSCAANNFLVNSVEIGDDIVFKANVQNSGNVRLKPKINVDIWDSEQAYIVKNFNYTGSEILPSRQGEAEFKVSSAGMEIGQYWVDISAIDCFASDVLTFDILEDGALRADGIISGIYASTWAEVDKTIPILVIFKNIGQKEIDSQFRGKISLNDQIVQVLESPVSNILTGDESNFTFYFTPSKSGRYIISGRVYYDKKKTFESSTIVNVNPVKTGFGQFVIYLIYIILTIVILFILYRIRAEKSKYLDKLRRIRGYG